MYKTIYKVTGLDTKKIYATFAERRDAETYQKGHNDAREILTGLWFADEISGKAYKAVELVWIDAEFINEEVSE